VTRIIYGIHPVREALKTSRLELQKILIGTDHPHPPLQSIIGLAAEKNVPVTPVTGETLARLTQNGVHQNVVAMVKETVPSGLEDILALSKRGGTKGLLLILDEIQDPQNFGSLIRTASGCGVQGIIIPRDRAVGITPAVVKASAGATAHVPVARVTNLATTIERLKEEGFWVFGAAAEAKERIYDLDLEVDLAIVIGAEGKGIRPLVKKRCDQLFSLPMTGPIASFNAAVSGGMILYEVMRQRGRKDGERKS